MHVVTPFCLFYQNQGHFGVFNYLALIRINKLILYSFILITPPSNYNIHTSSLSFSHKYWYFLTSSFDWLSIYLHITDIIDTILFNLPFKLTILAYKKKLILLIQVGLSLKFNNHQSIAFPSPLFYNYAHACGHKGLGYVYIGWMCIGICNLEGLVAFRLWPFGIVFGGIVVIICMSSCFNRGEFSWWLKMMMVFVWLFSLPTILS